MSSINHKTLIKEETKNKNVFILFLINVKTKAL